MEKLCPDELQHLRERERGVIVWFEFHSRQGEYYIKIIISTGCLLENNFPRLANAFLWVCVSEFCVGMLTHLEGFKFEEANQVEMRLSSIVSVANGRNF